MSSSNTKSPFIHLHVHSMYSLLDALGDVSDLVDRAKELGYDAIALTDHAGLYGAIEFYEAATKAGIKPIIGVEAYLAPNRLTDKRPRIDDHLSHLTMLAETNEGYQNLLKLVSISFLEGFYYKPRMDKDLLRAHATGLIALSGCLKGEIPKACQSHDLARAETLVREYQDIFGAENFFLELVHHPESSMQTTINAELVKLSHQTGAPCVATKDVHYRYPDEAEAQDALQCIHDGKVLSDTNRQSIVSIDHSLVAPDVMLQAFADIPGAIENTRKIADRCNVTLELGKNHLPPFDVPEGKTAKAYLRELCLVGLALRYPEGPSSEATERLDFELATIERMGFEAYFLIVHDYVAWAKEHGVIVGPGRGSAAGSIVAYALQITNLDPLAYGLLFERFLNPDRISMPDIDMDFDDVKRKDVIEYVMRKYGSDRVAGIITFGTMAARAAVRDVGRVLGWSFQDVDRVAKVIPPPVQGRHTPLAISVKEQPDFKAIYDGDPRARQLVDLAIKLEGTARHASQHACGIVITPKPLVEYAPLQKAQGGDVEQVIQYSLHSAEVIGLLKMDFLGLSNLTIIRECLDIARAVHEVEVDIDQIPLDDAATFALLGKGDTTGVFQLESDGIKRYIRELKPTVIEDIIAMVALYRPGPLGSGLVESFILRKHGQEAVTYKHPLTANALKNTYGIPVYQEQVMQVSKDMAGFTGGEADTMRKAMGKKNARLMAQMKDKFVTGSIQNGVERIIAEEIFQQFEEFAAYGFNKSHAACYAMIAYQTAYLKAHYPTCFMAALLNSDSGNLDRITIEVEECRRMGMTVLPPDINESFSRFSVVKLSPVIRFGLLAIKGLGEDVVEIIIDERKRNGLFLSLSDFVQRVPGRALNRKSLECLLRAGALDRFGDRNQLLFNLETILEFHRQHEREVASGQVNLFASAALSPAELQLRPAPPAHQRELLAWEKEVLGLYVSEHPFKEYMQTLQTLLVPINQLPQHHTAKSVRVGGVVTQVKKILTKQREFMLFVRLEDTTGGVEAVVFPRILQATGVCWEVDTLIIVSGRPQEKDGAMKVLVESAFVVTPENIEEVARGSDSSLVTQAVGEVTQLGVVLRVRTQLSETMLQRLQLVFAQHPGTCPIYFLIDDVHGPRKVKTASKLGFSEAVVQELEQVLGPGAVVIG